MQKTLEAPWKSPLYSPNYTSGERRAIQAHNFGVIMEAVSQYQFHVGEEIIPTPNLSVNGEPSQDALLYINQKDLFSRYITLFRNQNFVLAQYQIHAIQRLQLKHYDIETPHWLITNGKIDTEIGFEGNGFGTSLVYAGEATLEDWINALPGPERVLSLQSDGARGAEQGRGSGEDYRTGWTSSLLVSLGYTSDSETLKSYLGRDLAWDTYGHLWVKLLRE